MKKEGSIFKTCLIIFSALMISVPTLVYGQPLGDYGDAPEGPPAYFNGTPGNFPTCYYVGNAGYIVHLSAVVCLGDDSEAGGPPGLPPSPDWDSEPDGLHDPNCPLGCLNMCFDDDWTDEDLKGIPKTDPDAGVPLNPIIPCSSPETLDDVQICNVDSVDHDVYFNALFDWNQDGWWSDMMSTLFCTTPGDVSEWGIRNQVYSVLAGTCITPNIPFTYLPGPYSDTQDFWMRATVTTFPITEPPDPYEWTWGEIGGEFPNGESEDYFVANETHLTGACCYDPTGGGGPNAACTVTTQLDCENNLLGVYESDGSSCLGTEACCLQDGSCVDADALCCVNELGGNPQGPGTVCTAPEACCFDDGSCMDLDPLCCADLGGNPSPTGAPACLGDGNGNGTDDACEIGLKWIQPPDLSEFGMDVMDTAPFILADDFLCRITGPITEIHVWGSWLDDELPFDDPTAVFFILSIHEDLPVGHPDNPYPWSIPGEPICLIYDPAFIVAPYFAGPEGWFEPPQYYVFPGDFLCWEYIFILGPDECIQWGTEEEPIVYWLDVQAYPLEEYTYFGWKTTSPDNHWNDDGTWAFGEEPVPPLAWNELLYPETHPYFPLSIDLAFAIYGEEAPVPPLCQEYKDRYDCCVDLRDVQGRNIDPVACWALTKSGSAACNSAGCNWDAGKGMCLIDICLGDTNMDTFVAGGDSAQVDRDYGRTDCPCDASGDLCEKYDDMYDCCLGLAAAGRNLDPVACWALTKSGSAACNGANCYWDAGKGMCLIDICLGDTNMDTFVAGGDSAQVDRDYGRTDCLCPPTP